MENSNNDSRQGTESVLRRYSREYLKSEDAIIYFDPNSDPKYWETRFQLPNNFLN
jgi:hypothetical protein